MARIELDKLFASQNILNFVKELNSELTKAATTLETISSKKPLKGTGEDLKKGNEELEKLNKLTKQQAKTNKDLLKVNRIIAKQKAQQNKQIVKANEVRKQENAEIRKQVRGEVLLERVQGKAIKSYNDLNRQTSALIAKRNSLDITSKKGAKEFDKLSKQINKGTNRLKKWDSAIGRSQRHVGNYGRALRGLLSAFGLVGGVTIFAGAIKESIRLAGVTDGVKKAFDALNQPDLLGSLQEATRGTVTELKLMQAAVKAKNFKIPLDQLATFFEFATKRASQTGESVDFLVESIITGIGRKSPLILDNLGISASELSAEFKRVGDFGQAAGNIINEELGNMAEVAETGAQKAARLAATFKNLQTEIGTKLLPVVTKLLDFIQNLIAVFSGPNSLSDALSEVRDLLREQLNAFKGLIASIRGVNAETIELKDVINLLGDGIRFTLTPIRKLIEFNTKLLQAWTFLIKKGRELLEFLGILSKEDRLAAEEIARLQEEERKRQQMIQDRIERLKELNKVEEKNTTVIKNNTKAQEDNSKALEKRNSDLDKFLQSQLKAEEELSKREKEIILQASKDAFDIAVARFETQQALDQQEFATFTQTEEDKKLFAKVQANELFEFKTAKELEYLQFLKSIRTEDTALAQVQLDNQIEQLKASISLFKSEVTAVPEGVEPDETGRFSIWGALGLNEEQATAANSILQDTKVILNEFYQDQLNNYDALLSKSDERIQSLQGELDEQIKRDQDGDANTRDSLKRRLELEKSQQQALIKQREKTARRQKQIATTEAIINTALSVTNALSQKPFILGLILAIVAAAKGVVEINRIRNAQFYRGTESVPLGPNKPGRDTVPAMLTAEERVVPVKQARQIKGFPNKLLPAAVNYFLRGDGLLKSENSYNFTDVGGLESRQDETNNILNRYTNREQRIYQNGKLKEIHKGNVRTVFI